MKIDDSQIAERSIVGKTKDGRNIVYIATHGGLHALFCKDEEGNISAIGAAPHKAIARFLAGKKEPGIKWNEEFSKSEDLNKSEENTFKTLRKFMFTDISLQKTEVSDTYFIYDTVNSEISLMTKNEIIEGLKNKTIDKYTLVKNTSGNVKSVCLIDSEEFSIYAGE